MGKVYPAIRKAQDAAASERSVWTVWKKSSIGAQGIDGFLVYDGEGQLAFRVENYSRKYRLSPAAEIVLMAGNGDPLLFLRPHHILNVLKQWDGFKGENNSRTQIFCLKKRSVFQNTDDYEVFLNGPHGKSSVPDFCIEGSFWRRSCKIRTGGGESVAEVRRKMARPTVQLGSDVFSLIVEAGVDCELVMAFVVILDRVCQKPSIPMMCSYSPCVCDPNLIDSFIQK